ncbi:hypothetical protein [uncultured Desulfosarcina sp.]|uniref:hypothetical protein n=1 Tax=uncultured Desulfosarcina sp. TaxID=218289 RepID=UPI0029C6559D|nr:hypothetical protein [uncultured Desulfosarcina sp.]
MTKRDFKLLAAGMTVSGSIIGFFDNVVFPYHYLRIDGAGAQLPGFVRVLGWLLIAIAPLIYIILDWKSLFPTKRDRNEKDKETA